MPAERDLTALLKNMKPELQPGIFVFCTIAANAPVPAALNPLLTFREQEGTTLVVLREEAEAAGLNCAFPSRLITLTVHSALDAVGFLAAVAARLADAGISVNAVSAFHHDHLFVPVDRADDAMAALSEIALSPPSKNASMA
ncbi:ACT domain-containing protein [Bradyrhizobium manausense]|uniref:ACT domain-containing protein n=1 Tax=Bradyrhizobium manausense TaxID=989370 RepID=UPI001BAD6350|nr:ACT domain-containing protein [Bradyrhizobium manausense]MBR1089116.1 ACT domain-containing protein [Bradyrhizobium manausense]